MQTGLELSRADKEAAVALKRARLTTLTVRRGIAEGLYIDRDQHEASEAGRIVNAKRGLQQIAKSLRQVLADESDPERVKTILTQEFSSVLASTFGSQVRNQE